MRCSSGVVGEYATTNNGKSSEYAPAMSTGLAKDGGLDIAEVESSGEWCVNACGDEGGVPRP